MGNSRVEIKLTVTGPGERLTGFNYFWLKYVRGFNGDVHCSRCLVGPYNKLIDKHLPTGRSVDLIEAEGWDYLYLCGVSPKWPTNFHFAMRPGDGTMSMRTYNGFEFTGIGVERLKIPALPDGWNGLSKAFTTCRNYQFGVHYYG